MKVELSEGTTTNVAKRFSSCWTCKQEIQFDPTTKSKSNKLIRLSEDETIDDLSNQQRYELSRRIRGICIVKVIDSKLEEELLKCTDKPKLKPRTAIAPKVLPFNFSEVKPQRLHAAVEP